MKSNGEVYLDIWLHHWVTKNWSFGDIGTAATMDPGGTTIDLADIPPLNRLELHQDFLTRTIFVGYDFMKIVDFSSWGVGLLKPLQMLAQQMSVVMMHQAFVVGQYFDAEIQIKTQTLFNDLKTQAHHDYQPDFGMCRFGTNIRSLADAENKAEHTSTILARRATAREMGNVNISGGGGRYNDRVGRLEQFSNIYCDPKQNNPVDRDPSTGFGLVCALSDEDSDRVNRDIDYLRTVLLDRTLNIDFSDTTLTADEEDVLALANNLYAHDLFNHPGQGVLDVPANQDDYLELRSVVAKRSVAETSFNAQVGMRTRASTESASTATSMGVILAELGMAIEDIDAFLGLQPSYMAQMEVLAKKLYQHPTFYTELYTSPENVKRRGIAMQAINLMLDRDIYDSYLRSEAIMSVLLELKLRKAHDEVAAKMGILKNTK